MKLREIEGIKSVNSVKDLETGLETFVIVSTKESSLVLVPLKPGQFEEGNEEKYNFERKQETLGLFSVAGDKII